MKYFVKKVVSMAVTLLVVAFLVFLAFAVIPGDPATSRLGTEATPARVEALREEMGLNKPLPVRFGLWLNGFFKGDLGSSYSYNMPVKDMIRDKLPVTLTLTFMAFVMMIAAAVPVGLYTAWHNGGKADHIISVVNQVIMAVPPFFSGIMITYVFGLLLHLFTPGGYISYQTSVPGFIGYLFFPAAAIALPKAAMAAKLLKSSMVKESVQDYARTAYSRGNSTGQVMYRHLLKNALVPVVTFLGMALADMIAGSIIVEQVFGVPGLGRILLSSISNRDYPVVQAVIVCVAFLVIAINFLVDFIYHKIDPRITAD